MSATGKVRVCSAPDAIKQKCLLVCCLHCARCWTYETSLLVNQEVPEALPVTPFYEYFAPDYSISVVPSKEVERDNQNKKEVRATYMWGVQGGVLHVCMRMSAVNKQLEGSDSVTENLQHNCCCCSVDMQY